MLFEPQSRGYKLKEDSDLEPSIRAKIDLLFVLIKKKVKKQANKRKAKNKIMSPILFLHQEFHNFPG